MISDVFPDGKFPSNKRAADPLLIGDGWVGDETERFFKGRSLSEVNLTSLTCDYKEVWWSAQNFLDTEAYLFFLPAFMRIALDDFPASEGARMLADALSNQFLRMARGELDHRLVPLLENYSRPQIGAIAEFLLKLSRDRYEPVGDIDDAGEALRLYWARYLPRN